MVYAYVDKNGKQKQKWEPRESMEEAKIRKKEVEYKELKGTFVVPQCTTLNELLTEYVTLYGKNTWALSTYDQNERLIANYISPIIGKMKVSDITTRVMEQYYQKLLKVRAASGKFGQEKEKYVTARTVHNIHKVLRSCFEQAVKWEMIERNPCTHATLPKAVPQKREIWTAETIYHAIDVCTDDRLKLAIHLAFSASLRIGEMLALTWDCVDVSQTSIENNRPSVYINKEIQRVSREAMKELDNKDVVRIFPCASSRTKTLLVLKAPKTESSVRKVYLPKTVAEMLVQWKAEQEQLKLDLGDEYSDYQLVFAGPLGMPIEASVISSAFHKLIQENDLPPVVFHSLRHSSITYKLKLNGGNVKAVQGDSGHSQSNMVTDVYSHILDEDRCYNAQLFEQAFYSEASQTAKDKQEKLESTLGTDTLEKLLNSPDLAQLVRALVEKVS